MIFPLYSCNFFPAMEIMLTTCFIGFVDGASHHTKNLASSSWALYTPTYSLLWQAGVCIGHATNSQAEYTTVTRLPTDVVRMGIRNIQVHLVSQLIVAQLNGFYTVYNIILQHRYLQVRLLCRHFDTITFVHIPRCDNASVDHIANQLLDSNLLQ